MRFNGLVSAIRYKTYHGTWLAVSRHGAVLYPRLEMATAQRTQPRAVVGAPRRTA